MMDSYIVNQAERRFGLDINGDGYIGGEGRLSMLERYYGIDINGDGLIGRPLDVLPGFPAIFGYPSMTFGPRGRIVPTTGFVGPTLYQPNMNYGSAYMYRRG